MKCFIKSALLCLLIINSLALCSCKPEKTNTYQGYVEGRFTYVSSQVNGTLAEIKVHRGNPVKKGQLLFKLNPNPELYNEKEATAALTSAKASLKNLLTGKRKPALDAIAAQEKQTIAKIKYAKKTLQRYERLMKQGFLSKSQYDEALSNLHDLEQQLEQFRSNLSEAKLSARNQEIQAAKAKVKQEQALLETAQWQLSEKSISSPASGIIFNTFYRIGNNVEAFQPVLSMLTPHNVFVIFFVPEKTLAHIKLGEPVQISSSDHSEQLTAKISFISPQAEYTPPVIYSRQRMDKLVYRVEAKPSLTQALLFHPGQPVTVQLNAHAK